MKSKMSDTQCIRAIERQLKHGFNVCHISSLTQIGKQRIQSLMAKAGLVFVSKVKWNRNPRK